MAEQIQVLSPRTWGEFGNFLAATSLTRALSDQLAGAMVSLVEAEPLVPFLGEAGAQIRDITVTSPTPAVRRTRYLALMDEMTALFGHGFEVAPGAGERPELAGLVEHFRRTEPDVVIGTKGFLARLCLAATRVAGRPAAVASHVTNPGLLHLSIHRSPHLDLTMVSTQWARQLLVTVEGAPEDRIRVVGPLVAQREVGDFLAAGGIDRNPDASAWADPAEKSRPRIIIFSNRGGPAFPRIVEHLADRHPELDLVFVGYQDPDLARRAAEAGRAQWRFVTGLAQAEYFEYLDQAGGSPYALLISKSGPNTTLEAAYHGIPVLMLDSGLPMESWVAELIHDNGLGRCCATPEELMACLDEWLANPAIIQEHKRAATVFARDTLDQRAVRARVGTAVRDLLSARRGVR